MNLLGRFPRALLFFWFVQIGTVSVLWSFLPNNFTELVLVVLIGMNGVLIYNRSTELPTLTNIALILAIAHFWLGNGFFGGAMAAAFVFFGTAITGLLAKRIQNRAINREGLLRWCLLGLFTSQITTLTNFWPIDFFQKAILGMAVFYLVWQLWQVVEDERRVVLKHFIFVGLAVILVIASIIWTTWPGLKTL